MTAGAPLLDVLLVEDNPGDANLVRAYLEGSAAFDCELTHVGDLASAEARLRREPFDVILLDLSLPDGQGLHTLRRTCAAAAGVPVVVLTGRLDDDLGVAAVREGAQDYLTKGDLGARALGRSVLYALERRRAAESLRKAEERLRQAQKTEAVGRLAGGIAHDINNMMTVVISSCDLLLQGPGDGCRADRAMVEDIRRAGERAATVARQLLAYSRQQLLQPAAFDLNGVVAGLEPALASLAGPDVELTLLCADDLRPAWADPRQVEQVVLGLAANARDAMPRGGQLTLQTRNAERTAAGAPGAPGRRPCPYALLAVSDSGCGMGPEVRARLFEPFFTTKPPGQGTGLGLAMVHGIVTQSGGHIAVRSEPGRGTTFEVYLPQAVDS